MREDSYIGEIMLFAGSYAPEGWAACDGRLLRIQDHQAFFAVIGTQYGGDGKMTFAVPDLRGRAPIAWGKGPGLETYAFAQRGGNEKHTITLAEMPSHQHSLPKHKHTIPDHLHAIMASSDAGNQNEPLGNSLAEFNNPKKVYSDKAANVAMKSTAPASLVTDLGGDGQTEIAGSGVSIDIRSPYLAMTWCICLMGVFPVPS